MTGDCTNSGPSCDQNLFSAGRIPAERAKKQAALGKELRERLPPSARRSKELEAFMGCMKGGANGHVKSLHDLTGP